MPGNHSASRAALSAACRLIGGRIPLWTQGAGGNLSVKDGDRLFIKASGFRLDQVTDSSGVTCVDLPGLLSRLSRIGSDAAAEQAYADALKESKLPGADGRPSMETGFHAFLKGKWVAHFHSLPAVLMADDPGVEEWLSAKTKLRVKGFGAIRPGWELSKALESWGDTDVILLGCHGVILQSDSALSASSGVLREWAALEAGYCTHHKFKRLASLCLGEAVEAHGPVPPAPRRCYFPDAAVFLERLARIWEPAGNGLYRIAASAWKSDRDVAEIGLASLLLYEARSALKELPADIASTVAGLPTEAFRRSAVT